MDVSGMAGKRRESGKGSRRLAVYMKVYRAWKHEPLMTEVPRVVRLLNLEWGRLIICAGWLAGKPVG